MCLSSRFNVAWIRMDSICFEHHGIHCQSLCVCGRFRSHLPTLLSGKYKQCKSLSSSFFRDLFFFLHTVMPVVTFFILQCRSQNAPNFNNNNTQTNSNYMGSEMMGNILPPAPPPAGFIINPPLTLSQQHSSVQQHQQQNYNSSSPLPNVLVTSATNIW